MAGYVAVVPHVVVYGGPHDGETLSLTAADALCAEGRLKVLGITVRQRQEPMCFVIDVHCDVQLQEGRAMTGTQNLVEQSDRQRTAALEIVRDCGFTTGDQVRAAIARIERAAARADAIARIDALMGGNDQ
jgi:hypothetical protein